MKERTHKAEELYAHLAAEFLSMESNRQSLITVTRATLTDSLARGIIFITVFPESQERAAFSFLSRKVTDFKKFLKSRVTSRILPHFEFKIDNGEKNREHIDSISREQTRE